MPRSLLRAAVALVVVFATVTTPAAAAEPSDPGRSRLLAELRGTVMARHAATDQLRFVAGTEQRPAATAAKLGRPASPESAAGRFMARYGSLFGVRDAARSLRATSSTTDLLGRTVVRYQQHHDGVPVMAGDLLVQVGPRGDVMSANGEASTTAALDTRPTVTAQAAARDAVAAIAKSTGLAEADLSAGKPALWIHDPALLGGRGPAITRLVWRIDVTGGDRRELVLIDAHRGAVVLHFDQNADALNRLICNANNTGTKVPCTSPYARVEGQAATGIADVDNAYVFSGHTYAFFMNRFGRDSLDGAGMALKSTVRYCDPAYPCPYGNAFWDGQQMVYGAGYASADDVVGHELAHGVTDFSSHLYYYMQSGAINEALSDIFGEFIDLTNGAGTDTASARWLMGEDLPIGAIRDMETPSAYDQPDRMKSPYYTDDPFWYDQGGVHTNSGVANKAAFLMVDGGTFNGQTITGIGIDRSAAVWYRVEAQFLSSGSDYQDLGSYLNQACSDLVESSVKNSAGTVTGTIAAGDCTQVAKAVLATQMAQQPNVAQAPEAPVCTSGTPTNVVYDAIASGAPGWTDAGGDGANYGWFFGEWYATSGRYHLYAYGAADTDATMARTSATVIPSNAFLHFRHAFDTESGYDGGVLEYQVGAGAWTNAGPLFDANGHNGTIGAPVNGSAFTGFSYGYMSSRANLASLAGQSVKFRFRMVSDYALSYEGWYIDDFRIYTCSTDGTPPTVKAPNANFRLGTVAKTATPVRLNVKFTATDPSGIAATDLEQSVNGGTFTDVAMGSPTSTKVNLSVAPSTATTRRLRARATDGAGNTSGDATGPLFKVKAIQNGSAAIAQTGAWTNQSQTSFYGGSVRYASAAGARLSVTATMFDAAIVTTKGPNRGKAAVFVDGVRKATLDLYSSTTRYRQVAYVVTFAGPAASHKVELRALGTRNAASSGTRVDLDAFLLMTP